MCRSALRCFSLMGQFHMKTKFGAACLKRGEEVKNFPLCKFLKYFFPYTILKHFLFILDTQKQNHNQNCPFLIKDTNYLSFHSLAFLV
jgi:hypothetical protein